MDIYIDGLAVFIISMALSGIIIPQILLIAFRRSLFDEPDERKIHKTTVPRLGGMAFMPSIAFSLCLVIGAEIMFGEHFPASTTGTGLPPVASVMQLCLVSCCMLIMYLVGLADDLVSVRYRAKFVAQILAGLLMAAAGARIQNLHGMLGIEEIPVVLSYALTVLLVVYIINAINFIDGIDGLASGLSGIAMAFYGITFIMAGRWVYAFVAFAGLGTLVPFFYYNVFGNPAHHKKIFMGDTGSLTTGMLLAFLAFETTCMPATDSFGPDILVMAFAPLAIPCLDVLRVFIHRVIRGHSPFLPDRVHIHHKLLAAGIPQRLAMILIIVVSAVTIATNLLLSLFCGIFTVLMIDLVAWVIFNWWLSRIIYARQKKMGIVGGYE